MSAESYQVVKLGGRSGKVTGQHAVEQGDGSCARPIRDDDEHLATGQVEAPQPLRDQIFRSVLRQRLGH
ncbi:MAG: hypothetical protein ACR2MZ_03650 [Candidatus Dormibacter sp.]|uniref:hypothetical protein n=1 Tax=Candidatus Dormibacter sp. TaxID=2973982 RepID=UPI003D9B6B07